MRARIAVAPLFQGPLLSSTLLYPLSLSKHNKTRTQNSAFNVYCLTLETPLVTQYSVFGIGIRKTPKLIIALRVLLVFSRMVVYRISERSAGADTYPLSDD